MQKNWTSEEREAREEKEKGHSNELPSKSPKTSTTTTTTSTTKTTEEDAPDGGWGWVVTWAAFFVDVIASTPKHSFGVMYSQYFEELGTSGTSVSLIYNMAFVFSCTFTFFVGPLIQEFGWRLSTFISGLVFAVGLIGSAFATSAWGIFFSFSVVSGINIMFITCVLYTITQYYFTKKRTLSNAIVTSGYCVSELAMPLMITKLNEEYGYRGSILITGGIMLNVCVGAMVFHPVHWHAKNSSNREGESKTQLRENTSREIIITTKATTSEEIAKKSSIDTQVGVNKSTPEANTKAGKNMLRRISSGAVNNLMLLKSATFPLITMILSLNYYVLDNVAPLVPFAMLEAGFTQKDAALCLGVSGGCNLLAKIGFALITYYTSIRVSVVYMVGSTVSAVSVAVFCMVETVELRALCMGVYGAGASAVISFTSLLIVEQVGLDMLLPVTSITMLNNAAVMLVFGFLHGLAHDITGSYVASLWFLTASLGLSEILWFLLPAARAFDIRKGHLKDENQEIVNQPQESNEKSAINRVHVSQQQEERHQSLSQQDDHREQLYQQSQQATQDNPENLNTTKQPERTSMLKSLPSFSKRRDYSTLS